VTFAEALAAYVKLQQRLAVAMGGPVLKDVMLDPPLGNSDELSFQKLVAWCYVVLFETGRIPLNFLKELPPLLEFGALCPHVRDLRTWISHNLALDKPSDRKTLGNALLWLKNTSGSTNPTSSEHWGACCKKLLEEIAEVLVRAVSAADNLMTTEDGPKLREQLQKRLSAQWDAYLFDDIIRSCADLLGYAAIDAKAFRDRYLNAWRGVLESADPAKRDELIRLRIEADLLAEMANALPISAAEVLARAKVQTGTELAGAMLLIREAARKNRKDIAAVLEEAFRLTN
jgi:hypothetical protein